MSDRTAFRRGIENEPDKSDLSGKLLLTARAHLAFLDGLQDLLGQTREGIQFQPKLLKAPMLIVL